MNISIVILVTSIFFILLTILVKEQWKGIVTLFAVLINAGISSYIAIDVFNHNTYEEIFYGGYVFGEIPVRVDALSAWFILLMNFTALTGILYGRSYMQHYKNQTTNLTVHYVSYIIVHTAMIGIYCIQNSLAFLYIWELMTISSFLLIIFEHHKMEVIKAGINFLIQSHIGIVFLMIGFIWVRWYTNSYDFNAITQYTSSVSSAISFILFFCFFIGFSFKAGFVPFHTWLPYAHPAAPSHVSGMMSGVIIKLGIFGIMKMLLLIKGNYLIVGYVILAISVISGVYGVMLAIVQHNVKKLLAYHSIENIGIIGIGIGLGCIGLGINNSYLVFAGFAGALLHTLNHSLFKSLLFYSAGTVYQATHTMDIEHLGGLIKKMPQTATLFLIAALAISGLPPFNGFISEFLIYSGMFDGIYSSPLSTTLMIIVSVFGLVIIGGLAMLCFTKAFGIIFLGTERRPYTHSVKEADFFKLFPKYLVVILIIAIGLIPQLFVSVLSKPVSLFKDEVIINFQRDETVSMLQSISISVWVFILLTFFVFLIRKKFSSKVVSVSSTWGCGYVAPSSKMQYTANSFVRSYRKLAKPLLMMNKKENELKGIFPNQIHYHTHPYDKMEVIFIDVPIRYLKGFIRWFQFLQSGNLQFYILYGIIFIILLIIIPFIVKTIGSVLNLLNQI